MKTLPAKEFFPFIQQKQQQWGKWFEDYWKDLCTRGKLPTEYKMAMFAQGTPVENLILNSIRTKESDVTGQLQKQTEYQDTRNRVLMKLEPFKRALNQGSASGAVMASGLVDDMADIIARASLMDTTMGVSGNSKKKSVDTIIDQLIDQRFYFVDKYLVPKQLPQSLPSGTKLAPFIVSKDSLNQIRNVLDYLKTEDGMKSQAFMPSSAKNEFNARELRRGYEKGAYWVLNSKMDGVYLQYDYTDPENGWVGKYPVVKDNKERYEFKFKDLLRMETPKGTSWFFGKGPKQSPDSMSGEYTPGK